MAKKKPPETPPLTPAIMPATAPQAMPGIMPAMQPGMAVDDDKWPVRRKVKPLPCQGRDNGSATRTGRRMQQSCIEFPLAIRTKVEEVASLRTAEVADRYRSGPRKRHHPVTWTYRRIAKPFRLKYIASPGRLAWPLPCGRQTVTVFMVVCKNF